MSNQQGNFTIKPAGNNSGSFGDLVDLNDLFSEDFLPAEVDFNNVLEYDPNNFSTSSVNYGNYNQNNMPPAMGTHWQQQPSISAGGYPMYVPPPPNMMIQGQPPPSGMGMGMPAYPSQPPMMHGNQDAQQQQGQQGQQSEKKKSIVIPPIMPRMRPMFPPGTKPLPPHVSSASVIKAEGDADGDDGKKSSKKGKAGATGKGKKGTVEEEEDDLDDDDIDPSNMTESQRVERRERNREHAKRSRIRKRVLLETLQDQLAELREYNVKLRRVVSDNIPAEHAARILSECTTEESSLLANIAEDSDDDEKGKKGGSGGGTGIFKASRLTSNIAANLAQTHGSSSSSAGSSSNSNSNSSSSGAGAAPPKPGAKILMEPDFRLIHSLITSQQNFVLSDPSLPDNPIVYASDGFCRMSGYKRSDVLGRNCRFLQGPDTDQAAVDVIRKGIMEGRDISVCLLNYRADGSPFWNQFFLGALKDSDGQVVNYVGVQCEVNTIPITEIKDRVKRLPMPDDL